jgi:hypothetical protein
MKMEDRIVNAPRIQAALSELEDSIRQRYPSATFSVSHGFGDDLEGVYLIATVDLEDLTAVVDIYSDRLVDMQVEEDLPVHVIPVRPPERIAAMLDDRRSHANGDGPAA